MAGAPTERWERYFRGYTWYAAAGQRDVLILVSREEESEDVIHRKEGKLSEEDEERLELENIPSECWRKDVDLIKERYSKDKITMLSVRVEDGLRMSKGDALEHIKMLLNNIEQHGATIHYIGPGRKDTGDWCFSDGFITFEDIARLYLPHFRKKTLVIAADCSYSGQWVKRCKDFLDYEKIRPCGHYAMESRVQLKVFCSCQPNETGYTLLYSARGNCNDKYTGAKYVITDMEIASGQTTCFVDSTKIHCGKAPEEKCVLMPDFTFAEKTKRNRILRIFKETGQDLQAWRAILLEDDPEKIRRFEEVMQGDMPDPSVTISNYGRVSKVKKSQKQIEDWISRMKNGIEDINDDDFM